ncbi:MAG: RidA family protein [Elusimicrobiota bacterium]
MKKAILSPNAPKAIGPYSQAVSAGGFVFLSGQVPVDPLTGNLVEGAVAVQAARVFENLKAVLASGGLDFSHVVKTTVYLCDMSDFAEVNEVYARYFNEPYPARATVAVAALPRGARIEVDAIAIVR